MNNPKYIIIHCTAYSYRTLFDQFVACNGWHKDRQFPLSSLGLYIGYQRLITGDKNYQCRLDTDEGAHCNQQIGGISMNFQSLGVCLGFDGDIEFPTANQYILLQKQVWDWQDKYNIPNTNIFFHRHFATNKTCPGNLITDQWMKDLLIRPLPLPIIPSPDRCTEAEVKKEAWYNSFLKSVGLIK